MKLKTKQTYSNVTIQNTSIFLTLNVPFSLNCVTGVSVIQMIVWVNEEGKKQYELEAMDVIDMVYMGRSIQGYKAVREFLDYHKNLGINIEEQIDANVAESFNEKIVARILKDINFSNE